MARAELPLPPHPISWDYEKTRITTERVLVPAFKEAQALYKQGELSGHSYGEDWVLANPDNPKEQFTLHVYHQNSYPSCENELSDMHLVHSLQRMSPFGQTTEIMEDVLVKVAYNSHYEKYEVDALYRDDHGALVPCQTAREVDLILTDMVAQIMAF